MGGNRRLLTSDAECSMQVWHGGQRAHLVPSTHLKVQLLVPARASREQQFLMEAASYPPRRRFSWLGTIAPSTPPTPTMVMAVLQSLNGQLYFGTQAITTQNSLVVTPTLTAVSEADAMRLIRQF